MKVRCITNDRNFYNLNKEWLQRHFHDEHTDDLLPFTSVFHIFITSVNHPEALLIKRLIISAGGECLMSGSGCAPGSANLLLIGSLNIFKTVADDISDAELALSPLGKEIETAAANYLKKQEDITACGFTFNLSQRTAVMGILNVTPDSFSDGGKFIEIDKAVLHGRTMFENGADIIDIGGESTRPGAEAIDEIIEIKRTLPIIEKLSESGVPVSIDTSKSGVAREAVKAGAVMINDISGLRFDPGIVEVAGEFGTFLVIMHIKGKPRDMQNDTNYDDLMGEIIEYLYISAESAKKAGVNEDKIIVDPGIGFGKSFPQNLEIIRRLRELKVLGYPVLVGPSRKAFIGAITGKPAPERLYGTCAVCAAAAVNGADILRVHDASEIAQVAKTIDCVTGKLSFDEAVKN